MNSIIFSSTMRRGISSAWGRFNSSRITKHRQLFCKFCGKYCTHSGRYRQQRIIPAPSSSVHQPTQLVEQHHVPVSIAPAPRVLHSAGTGHLQKQQDGTFCFAQMGSGGQFTAVPHNEMVVDSHHKLQTVQKAPVMVNTGTIRYFLLFRISFSVMAPPSSAGPSRVAMTTVDKSSSLATGALDHAIDV